MKASEPRVEAESGAGGAGAVRHGPATLGAGALIVVPTYDERASLRQLVSAVLAAAPCAQVLIVDDHSPDGTGALADELSVCDQRVSVLHRPRRLGLGSAYVDGFRWALERDFRHFVEMDADLSHDPRYLAPLLAGLEAGADVVLGSRNVPGGGVRGWGLGRLLLSRGGSLYSRLVLDVPVRDLTTGFKAFTRRALLAIGLDKVCSNGYAFQIEMTFRALRAGLTVLETPIVFVDRRAGQSKLDGRVFAEAIVMPWRLRLELARGRL